MWTIRLRRFSSRLPGSAPVKHFNNPTVSRFARVSQFFEIARPKVNLTLRILGKRPDGYHALASVVAFANGPSDRLKLDCARRRGVTVTGPFAGSIAGVNLLETVLDLVADAAGAAPASLPPLRLGHVHLEKCLPVAAGIGGGSADAGALLRAIRTANPELATVIDWNAIALRLGADVPVCLLNRAAFMTGVGEQLTPLADLSQLPVVLANPLVPVPADKTARVFRALAAEPLPGNNAEPLPPHGISLERLITLIETGNDLQRAACDVVPAIADVLQELRSTPGCRVAVMSGAGPTCFGVFDDQSATRSAAQQLSARHPKWWIAAADLG